MKIEQNLLATALLLKAISDEYKKLPRNDKEIFLKKIAQDSSLCELLALCFARLPNKNLAFGINLSSADQIKQNFPLFVELRGCDLKGKWEFKSNRPFNNEILRLLKTYNIDATAAAILNKADRDGKHSPKYSTRSEEELDNYLNPTTGPTPQREELTSEVALEKYSKNLISPQPSAPPAEDMIQQQPSAPVAEAMISDSSNLISSQPNLGYSVKEQVRTTPITEAPIPPYNPNYRQTIIQPSTVGAAQSQHSQQTPFSQNGTRFVGNNMHQVSAMTEWPSAPIGVINLTSSSSNATSNTERTEFAAYTG